ncbi:MAG: FUN14 domain-containing protein [Methylococcales bacterium]|nr:FUN14 domain-containing protein [Methylococcales bacterium]
MNSSNVDSAVENDIFSSSFLMGNVGAPFVIGMAVGFFAKKMLQMALFVGGLILVILFVAEYYEIITINNNVLQDAASSLMHSARDSGGFLLDRLSAITSQGVSGVGGFYVGFKLG